MHISESTRRDRNVLAAWAVAVADAIRVSAEQSTGMAGAAPAALVAIVADAGMSVDELRRVLGLTHPGAVRLVDRLVRRGWIRREHATGRTLRLTPTPAGQDAERRIVAAREQAIDALHAALDEERLRALADLVGPVLAGATGGLEDLRRLCRLCNRDVCDPCPVADTLDHAPRDSATRRNQ